MDLPPWAVQLRKQVGSLEGQVSSLVPRVDKLETSLFVLQDAVIKTQKIEINYKLATGETISGINRMVQALAMHQLNVHGVTIPQLPQQPGGSNIPTAPDATHVPVAATSALPVAVPVVSAVSAAPVGSSSAAVPSFPASAPGVVTAPNAANATIVPANNIQTAREAAAVSATVSRRAHTVGHVVGTWPPYPSCSPFFPRRNAAI